jgi:rubrerythrin
MADYVSVDVLLSAAEDYDWISGLKTVLKRIPAADVRPVVRGEWEETAIIPDAYDICGVITWASKIRCKKCGFTTYAIEGGFSQYNFCPSCGADNREVTANGN